MGCQRARSVAPPALHGSRRGPHAARRSRSTATSARNGEADFTNRIIDLLCPLGKGQRAMIVAPAKAGKTTVLQAIGEGIVRNYPESSVYILLVDERPEEVTEMEMCGYGEVVASSFDYPAERHVQVAEITLRARAPEGRNGPGRGDHPGLDHPPRACLQHGRERHRPHPDRRPGRRLAQKAQAIPRQRPLH